MHDTQTKNLTVTSVPAEDIEFLKPHAVRAGIRSGDAGACRWAVVELSKRLREEQKQSDQPPPAQHRKAV